MVGCYICRYRIHRISREIDWNFTKDKIEMNNANFSSASFPVDYQFRGVILESAISRKLCWYRCGSKSGLGWLGGFRDANMNNANFTDAYLEQVSFDTTLP